MRPRATGMVLALAGALAGCSTPRMTETARTAVEQLLLSTAADRAIQTIDLTDAKGKKAFLDVSHFESYDKGYVLAALREQLGKRGLALVADRKEAEWIIEPRCGALATDSASVLVGIPSVPLPLPTGTSVSTPELALLKQVTQIATAKIALNVIDYKTGAHRQATGPRHGKAYYTRWTILIFSFNATDLPERPHAKALFESELFQPPGSDHGKEGGT